MIQTSLDIDLIFVLPELALALFCMGLLMLGVFSKPEKAYDRVMTWAYFAFACTLGLTMANDNGGVQIAFNGLYIDTAFITFAKSLILIAALGAITLSYRYLQVNHTARFEFPVLVGFATLGMMLMVSANDMLAFYMGLELQSLSLYILASFQRDNTKSSEAGLKYFVLGALASGMLLYGISFIYGATGSTKFMTIMKVLLENPAAHTGVTLGLVLMSVGMAFKISAVPFHMWTPDVYQGAPTPVTAFFAIAPKIAALVIFARLLLGPFHALADQWQQIIFFVSAASMVVGSVAAIAQTNLKRLLAYSAIGHVGFLLMGIVVHTPMGLVAMMIYLALYAVVSLGAFAVVLCLRRNGQYVDDIADLRGLSQSHPRLALAFAILVFALAGVPPTAGFFGKLYIFLAAVQAQQFALVVLAVIMSVVATFYYLRLIKIMYFDAPDAPSATPALDRAVPLELGLLITVSTIITLGFIMVPAPLIERLGQIIVPGFPLP